MKIITAMNMIKQYKAWNSPKPEKSIFFSLILEYFKKTQNHKKPSFETIYEEVPILEQRFFTLFFTFNCHISNNLIYGNYFFV